MGQRVWVAVSVATALLAAATAPALTQTPQPQNGPPQQQESAPKPYKAVTITPPAALEDPAFAAFRKQLGAAAQKKDRRALAAMIAANFFWIGEKGDKADKRKPGIDNLSKAIGLDNKDAEGWDILAAYAADPTAMPFPDRKDTVCAPADPGFDAKEFEELIKSTGTDPGEWDYPMEPNLEMHSGPQPNAPVLETLGMYFVRVMPDDGAGSTDSPMLRVVAPSGKVGFVPIDALSSLGNDQICYSKDGGGWKIFGVIGGEP
jgi:hypothetical protein